MLVQELIQQLCDNPNDLLKELQSKYAVLCEERKDVELRMSNLKKVIRIATDVKSRLARNEQEIGALHEQLVRARDEEGFGGVLDFTNLYALTDMPEGSSY